MNKDGHSAVSQYFFVILVALGLIPFFGSPMNVFLFSVSFAFFSTQLTPDIDLKIPFLPHRGATHDLRGIVVMAILIGAIGWYLLGSISAEWSFLPPIMLGMAIAWMLHSVVDFIQDNANKTGISQASWIVVYGAIILTFFHLKGA